jgi:3-oxoacyl-[acyl-carrier protein] reductase
MITRSLRQRRPVDLGMQGRVVLLASDDRVDREACAAVLRGEGADVLTATVRDAADQAAGVDAVVVLLPVSTSAVLDAGLSDLREDWGQLEAVAAAFQAAVPTMTERHWGRLVTVVSGAVKSLDDESDERGAVVGLAVLGLHKAVVADVARSGITTNAVLRDHRTTPEEIASTVAFLLSEPAGYLQGVTIALDGARSGSVF